MGPVRRVTWIARVIQYLKKSTNPDIANFLQQADWPEMIDWATFQLAWAALGEIFDNRGWTRTPIEEARAVEPGKDLRSDLILCDGMDAVHILAASTSRYRPRGLATASSVTALQLLSMLRIAYDLSELERDEIFLRMRTWERANIRYPLLRSWRSLDPLGEVLDQRYWEPDLASTVRLLKEKEPIALFKTDLDQFKPVNDALGHTKGDEAIKLYCRIVREILGTVGEVYRRGGDEVVVIAPGLAETRARELAERLRLEIERRFCEWAREHASPAVPTASIGLVVAVGPAPISCLTRLLDEAEKQAKQQGKNRVFFLPGKSQ